MIFGTGIDIVKIKKIKRAIERWGKHFSERIFTSEELIYCQKKKPPFQHLAARFAAKEAFLKALGRAERSGIRWKEIQINNKEGGQPFYCLEGSAKSLVNREKIRPFLTISHTGDYAIAHCLLEK
ncbi:MAG: holo-ACP synthase [Candidatus Omnitrophica bacterium]|nr:holo-ACP synthase [Candidatus Omnitrophota bacterium]